MHEKLKTYTGKKSAVVNIKLSRLIREKFDYLSLNKKFNLTIRNSNYKLNNRLCHSFV